MRIEIKSLENRDMNNDLWKDKCREMMEITQELQQENDTVRSQYYQSETRLAVLVSENERLQQEIQNKHVAGHVPQKSSTLRETVILQRKAGQKPMTASGASRTKSNHMQSLATHRQTERNPMES
jgi:predicted nuclease with TOPRIM domain